MIIGDVELDNDAGSLTALIRVDYTLDEALTLNKTLNCMSDINSWVLFLVKPSVENGSYYDCYISDISMHTCIENKIYKLRATLFSDELIDGVLNAANKLFENEYECKRQERIKVESFKFDGDFSDKRAFPPEYCNLKNSQLYGCKKFD